MKAYDPQILFASWSIILVSALIQIFVNAMSRRGVFFGVSIPEKYLKEERLKEIQRHFIWTIILFHLVFLFTSIYLFHPLISAFIALIFGFLIFGFYNKRVKAWKSETDLNIEKPDAVRVDLQYSRDKIKHFKKVRPYYIIPLVINILSIIIVAINYDKIPEVFPIHWNFSGPDGFSEKTFFRVFSTASMGLLITLTYIFVNYTILNMKQNLRFEGEAGILAQKKSRKAWTIYLIAGAIILSILFFFTSLDIINYNIPKMIYPVLISLTLIYFIFATIYVAFKYGISGEKLYKDKEVTYREDDENWYVFGTCYYNPDDPSFMVEKRVGIGSTVNFAHPGGKVMAVVSIGILIFTFYLLVSELV